MYNKASLYQEVQHLREYMGISLSDTTLDIIEYCKREYSDIKTEAIKDFRFTRNDGASGKQF